MRVGKSGKSVTISNTIKNLRFKVFVTFSDLNLLMNILHLFLQAVSMAAWRFLLCRFPE
jgi:hypothetical protein